MEGLRFLFVTVWEGFESAATRFADRPAVQLQRADAIDSWTYHELYETALARARWLAGVGIKPGDRCAIYADNDAAWCGTYLGILRAGAVAVPLDTNYSAGQVATILRDSSPRVLFANARLLAVAREAVAAVHDTILADVHRFESAGSTELPAFASTAADPAVILYTSGTTADPKGVVLTNSNLIAERDAAFQVISVSEHDSVLGVLPLFHALALLANLLLPTAVGARIVFLETVNSTELVRALSERRITIFACVPQFFYLIHQRVMKQVESRGRPGKVLFRTLLEINFHSRRLGMNLGPRLFGRVHTVMGRQMRLFVTGGSKFDPAVGRDFYALGFTILQAYGLTETSGAATLTSPDEAHLDTVGRALPGQEITVLPPDDAELDGEIAIRGPIVMQGYFGRPEATHAVMRDGWFLSGDLGRLDEHGRLSITGRKKDVIVLASGKNIYPEEIEAHYRQSPYIKEICVLGLPREDEPTTERLFAVVTPDLELLRERRIVNAGDLLRFEMEGQAVHLPPHKRVLGYEVWFESLPRTTTGKLKRHEIERRLRQKGRERAREQQPEAGEEWWADDSHASAAVEVIARRAKGRTIARDSNLELDLGLDSMERVELLTEIEQRFGVHIPEQHAHQIFTVTQLIDAARTGALAGHGQSNDDSWAVMLRDLPSADDPTLSGLLEPRPIAAPFFFAVSRLARLVLPPVHVTGLKHLPPEGPYIISPNHQGYLDPFVVCGVLPYRLFRQLFFVGAAEYFESGFMAWLARQANCVPVDPDANLVPAMKAGAFGLTHRRILMLFPEGERSIDGTVKRFKKGAPILSRHLDVPIVPVAIRGAYEMWPRNRRIDWRMMFPWNRHCVRVAIGPPVSFDGASNYGDAATALQRKVAAMWDALA